MQKIAPDHGTDGQAAMARQREVVTVPGVGKHVRYNDACLLDALRAQKQITDPMYEAGIWFRERWFDAGLVRRCTMSGGGGGGAEPSQAQEWNAKCYDDTLRALPGYSMTLIAVCCEDSPRHLVVTRRALAALAEHRGIR
ncbi:hypothetical protein ACFOGJ_16150 [Marinibaculum pumilum]|uniref:Uncharacterized protein n=1 Tax=Marinibaculum pumilum TaxID=1766165 RepID=A0ABV7L2F2_9PROT